MKSVIYLLIALATLGIANSAEQAVTWSKYNPEQIPLIKNASLTQDGVLYYSEYNANNDKWNIRTNNPLGLTDTLITLTGLDNCERLIQTSNGKFAITQTGKLYKYSEGTASWSMLTLPTNDYQTDKVLYLGTKLFIFPKYGQIYSSTNDGVSWTVVNNSGFIPSTYNGFVVSDVLYVIRINALYYSTNVGTTWNSVPSPAGTETIQDYVIHNNNVYIWDNLNNVYLYNNGSYELVASTSTKIFGLTFNNNSDLFISTTDGIYKKAATGTDLNKVFTYINEIPSASSNYFCSRGANKGDTLAFTLVNNEIIESVDGGNTWRYIRFNLKNANIEQMIVNQNELIALSKNKLYKSNVKNKVWFETTGIDINNSIYMGYNSNGIGVSVVNGNGVKTINPYLSVWQDASTPTNNIQIQSMAINSSEVVVLLSNAGLLKYSSEESTWKIINSNINNGILKSSNSKIYWLRNGIASEIDDAGNILNNISLINTYKGTITDLVNTSDGVYITSNVGLFLYNPNTNPIYTKISSGLFSNDLLKIQILNSQLFVLDAENNIFVSSTNRKNFGVYNISDNSVNISDILSDGVNKVYLATKNSGIWLTDKINTSAVNTDEYWTANADYFEHSKLTNPVALLSNSSDGKKVYTVAENNEESFFRINDLYTGRLDKEFSLSVLDSNDCSANAIVDAAVVNPSDNYLAIAYSQNCKGAAIDTVRIINLADQTQFRAFSIIPSTQNTIIRKLSHKLSFQNATNNLIVASTYIEKTSAGDTLTNSYINIWNIGLGQKIKDFALPQYTDQATGKITFIGNSRDKNIIAAATVNNTKSGASKHNESQIVLFNANDATNIVALSIPDVASINTVLFSKDNDKILIATAQDANMAIGANDALYLLNQSTGRVTKTDGIRVKDVMYSADSIMCIMNGIIKESGSEIAKIIYGDLNSLDELASSTINKDYLGKMTLDKSQDRIIIAGQDKVLRSFVNIKAASNLIADFSSATKIAVINTPVEFFNLSTGNPQSFEWNFGDGHKSSQKNPIYNYTNPGLYSVSLKIWKNGISDTITKSNYIKILSSAKTDFTADVIDGYAPLTVKFTEVFAGELVSRKWLFGDGEVAYTQNPTHIYKRDGKYNVALITDNGISIDTVTKEEYINVDTIPSVFNVDFTSNVQTGSLPLEIKFTPTSFPSSTYWEWNFGDGTKSTEKNPIHTYTDYGNYTVTLKSGKGSYYGNATKKGFIKVDRGAIGGGLNVINEFENNILNYNSIGLSAVQASDNTVGFDIAVDSAKKVEYGVLGILDTDLKRIEMTNLSILGNNPTPRYLAAIPDKGFSLFSSELFNSKLNVRVNQYNLIGSQTAQFLVRKNKKTEPVASFTDGANLLIASVANDSILCISKYNTDTQILFDKEYFGNIQFKEKFVKIIKVSDGYYIFIKENDNSIAKALKISDQGDSVAVKSLFEKAYYHLSDVYTDADGNIVVAGSFKYLTELDPVYNFITKLDANLNQIMFSQVNGAGIAINSVDETIDRNNAKKYILAGSIDGNAGFISLDANGVEVDKWKLLNRPGYFNNVLTLKNSEIILTGALLNQKSKMNFYALQLSANNTYAGVEEIAGTNELRISPNPNNGILSLSMENSFNTLNVFNTVGECVHTIKNEGLNNSIIDLTNLPVGIYTLFVTDGKISKQGRLVIVK